MNEEEKEAIKTIKNLKEARWYSHAFDNGTEILDEEEKKDIDVILDLIEKLQKENEKLNNENQRQFKLISNIHDKYKERLENADIELKILRDNYSSGKEVFKLKCDEIDKLKEKNKMLKELLVLNHYAEKAEMIKDLNYYKDLANCYQGNCVSKDKIRNKIKELEEEYQMYVGREYTEMSNLIIKIKVLQELLGDDE